MKPYIVLILLLLTQPVYSQVSNDSLRKLVDQAPFMSYEQNYMIFNSKSNVADTIMELFPGTFYEAKLFLATYKSTRDGDHGLNYFPKLCLLNTTTGATVNFSDTLAFYHFINHTRKQILPVDKAYLYLFLYLNILNTEQEWITQPKEYPLSVGMGSAFCDLQVDKLFLNNYNQGSLILVDRSPVARQQKKENLLYSCDKSIALYTGNMRTSTGYLYHFLFNDHYELTDVKVDTYKYH